MFWEGCGTSHAVTTRAFQKPALSIDDQIRYLRNAGMHIASEDRARHWLARVSYYRLSGYWHIFKVPVPGATRFRPNTDFDTITELYTFDRRLRRQVARASEHVEIALRGSWAYQLAQRGGPHGYLDAALYNDRKHYHDNLAKLAREVGTSPETYIKHYRDNYDEPSLPAVWMAAEMMTFGQLSRWYSSLGDPGLRESISQPFSLPEALLVPIIKHLVSVRNVCAHQGRLWNRRFRDAPRLPRKPSDLGDTLDHTVASAPGSIYNSLVLLTYIVSQIAPSSRWRDDLKDHLGTLPMPDMSAMLFPGDWRDRPLWR